MSALNLGYLNMIREDSSLYYNEEFNYYFSSKINELFLKFPNFRESIQYRNYIEVVKSIAQEEGSNLVDLRKTNYFSMLLSSFVQSSPFLQYVFQRIFSYRPNSEFKEVRFDQRLTQQEAEIKRIQAMFDAVEKYISSKC